MIVTKKKSEVKAKKNPKTEPKKAENKVEAVQAAVETSPAAGQGLPNQPANPQQPSQPANPQPGQPVAGGKKPADLVEEKIKLIIEKAKKKGYITYEEMNNELPDESISPNRLESLIMTLDEMGISLLDESEMEKRREEDEEFEVDDDVFVDEEAAAEEAEDLVLETELVEGDVGRIDDPIRKYRLPAR